MRKRRCTCTMQHVHVRVQCTYSVDLSFMYMCVGLHVHKYNSLTNTVLRMCMQIRVYTNKYIHRLTNTCVFGSKHGIREELAPPVCRWPLTYIQVARGAKRCMRHRPWRSSQPPVSAATWLLSVDLGEQPHGAASSPTCFRYTPRGTSSSCVLPPSLSKTCLATFHGCILLRPHTRTATLMHANAMFYLAAVFSKTSSRTASSAL